MCAIESGFWERNWCLIIACLGVVCMSTRGYGDIIAYGDSHYEIVEVQITWSEAVDAAQAHSYEGVQGRLVSITNRGEWVTFSRMELPDRVALGRFNDDPNQHVLAWEWLSGEAEAYGPWIRDEPALVDGRAGAVILSSEGAAIGWGAVAADSEILDGYIVEYVPEPSGFLMFTVGCLAGGLALLRQGYAG